MDIKPRINEHYSHALYIRLRDPMLNAAREACCVRWNGSGIEITGNPQVCASMKESFPEWDMITTQAEVERLMADILLALKSQIGLEFELEQE